ncbi:MAG: winged helix-turn-helix transcriptional regulator [Nitrososphaeraceae archaeon]
MIKNNRFFLKNNNKSSNNKDEECKLLDIWDVLGRKWSLLILKNLSIRKSVRFNELKRMLKGISSTVLSDRLYELEKEGLVSKKIYQEIPLRVEYNLTSKTKDLEPILKNLDKWCEKWEENH